MDISNFIQTGGHKQVQNPNYNPRSKKNKEPRFIDVIDLGVENSSTLDLARKSVENNWTVDSKTYDKYAKYGIEYKPSEAASGSLDVQLAREQSGWEKLRNALDQAVVSEIGLGTAIAFTDLFDIISGAAFQNDGDYQNAASEYLTKLQDQFKESHGIYQDPSKSHWSDFGWWCSNVPSIMSSLTLLLPGIGVSQLAKLGLKGAGMAIRGTKTISKLNKAGRAIDAVEETTESAARFGRTADKAMDAARAAERAPKATVMGKLLSNPSSQARLERLVDAGVGGLTQRHLENYQEARQTYNDMFTEMNESVQDMNDEDYQKLIERNQELLKDKNVDLSDRTAVVKAICKEAADRTYQMDYANLIFDVAQMYMLGNPLKLPKNFRVDTAVAKAQRESLRYGHLSPEQQAKAIAERSRKQKVKDWISDRAHIAPKALTEMTEGVEEAVNYIAQQEGIHYGKLMFDINRDINDDLYWGDRYRNYFGSSELYEAAFWGWLGGIAFGAGGNGVRRAIRATKETNRINKKAESEEQKTTWKAQWELSDSNRRVEDINKRYEKFSNLAKYREQIFEKGENPFKHSDVDPTKFEALETDQEKEVTWQKAQDDFISQLTLDAIDKGNYNLLREYLQSDNIRKALLDAKVIDNNTSMSSYLNRMEEIDRMYTDNLVAIDNVAGKVARDASVEEMQILARNNTLAQIHHEHVKNALEGYKLSAEANERRFKGILDDDFDYKTGVTIIEATRRLTQLKNAKAKIENDPKKKASIDGQVMLRRINQSIKAINTHLMDNIISNKVDEEGNPVVASYSDRVARTIYAHFSSTGEGTESYANLLQAISTADMKGIEKEIGVKFETTDEDIVKLFGPKEALGTGKFKILSDELITHFGNEYTYENILDEEGKPKKYSDGTVQRKRILKKLNDFEQIAGSLKKDYETIAGLELALIEDLENIKLSENNIKSQLQNIHNYMDVARQKAIKEASEIIKELRLKYGSDAIYDYIFENSKSDAITTEDRQKLDQALDVLNLTADSNQSVAQDIRNIIMTDEFYEQMRKENEEKSSSASQNSNPEPPNPNVQPSSQPSGKTTTSTKTRVILNFGVDKITMSEGSINSNNGILVTKIVEEETINGNKVTNTKYVVDTAPGMLNQQNLETLAKNNDVTENYNPNDKSPYSFIKAPVFTVDDNGNVTVLEKGRLVYNTQPVQAPAPNPQQNPGQTPGLTPEELEAVKLQQEAEANRKQEREWLAGFAELILSSGNEVTVDSIDKAYNDYISQHPEAKSFLSLPARRFKVRVEKSNNIAAEIANIAGLTLATVNTINQANVMYSSVTESGTQPDLDIMVNSINGILNLFINSPVISDEFKITSEKPYVSLATLLTKLNELGISANAAELRNIILNVLQNPTYAAKLNYTVIDDSENWNETKTFDDLKNERKEIKEGLRIDISDIEEQDEDKQKEWYKAFSKLKVGDNITIKVVGNELVYYVKDKNKEVKIGSTPIVIADNFGNYKTIVKGWKYNVNKNGTSKLYNVFSSLIKDKNILEKIIKLNYNNKLTFDEQNNLIIDIYNSIKQTASDYISDSPDDVFAIVKHFANICKYAIPTYAFSPQFTNKDIQTAITNSLENWFKKLANNYNQIYDLKDNKKEIKLPISKINSGSLIRLVPSDVNFNAAEERNNYALFMPSNEALENSDDAKLLVTNVRKDDTGFVHYFSGQDPDVVKRISKILENKDYRAGIPLITIPNQNGALEVCVGTMTALNDEQLVNESNNVIPWFAKNSTTPSVSVKNNTLFAKTRKALLEYFNDCIEEFKNKGNSKNLETCLNLMYGGTRMLHDPEGFRVIIYKNKLKFIEDKVKKEENIDINKVTDDYIERIKSIVNRSTFSLNFSAFNNEPDPYTNYGMVDKNKFRIVIPALKDKNNKQKSGFIYEDTLENIFIKGGFLRLNTKRDNITGSNFASTGTNIAANRTIEVNYDAVVNTNPPVEKNENDSNKEREELIKLLKSKRRSKAVTIFKRGLPNIKQSTIKSLQNFGLLPKSVTFAENLDYKYNAEVNNATGEVGLGNRWLDLFTGSGQYATDNDVLRESNRRIALRKLIHESLHNHIRLKDVKLDDGTITNEYINRCAEIYNEFKAWLDTQSEETQKQFYTYLFEDKETDAERIEEFIVESLTSKELCEKLNTIKTTYEVDEQKLEDAKNNKTLWDKILNLIAKLFNYQGLSTKKRNLTPTEGTLLAKQIYALQDALINSKLENTNETNENIGDETEENTVTKPTNVDIDSLDMDDFDSFNSVPTEEKTEEELAKEEERRLELEAIEEELQEIKDQAIADGTFMKAPNGNPTNLNERQWLQVRTKAFKNWFGDWLGVNKFNREAIDISRVDIEETSNPNEHEGNKTLKIYLKGQHEKGHFELVKDREFGQYSVHLKTDKSKLEKGDTKILFEELSKAIPEGAIVSTWGSLSEDGVRALNNNIGRGMTKIGEKDATLKSDGSKIKIPIYQKGEGVSKVVDENGEPLVVYHGTDNENLTKFDNTRNIWFGSKIAHEYYISYPSQRNAKLKPIFVNIKKPSSDITKKFDYDINVRKLQYTKNDGVLPKAFVEGNVTKSEIASLQGFALFSNQIKSADDNIGSFSSENDDIRYSSVTEEASPSVRENNSKILMTDSSIDHIIDNLKPNIKPIFVEMWQNGVLSHYCK